MSREDHRKHDAELQRLHELQRASASEGFKLRPSDMLAICTGIIVAIILYLQDKTPMMIVSCLLVLTACLEYLLLHWCNQWRWILKATPNSRLVRLVLVGIGVSASVAAYGKHVWPKRVQTGTEAKIEELRTEIRTLLEPLGDNLSRQKLLARYPLGYVIFDVDYKNSVFPYESQAALDRYEFDWSVVKFTQNTAGRIALRFPNVAEKGKKPFAKNILIEGSRSVGEFGMGYYFGDVLMTGEILAFRQNGVVFLVGFKPTPNLPWLNLPGRD